MNIIHTSMECYPIAKVGGLADVVGALPKYQNNLGYNVTVITPFYNNSFVANADVSDIHSSKIILGDHDHEYTLKKLVSPDLGFSAYFVYIKGILDRREVYGHTDDIERSIAFQLAILDWLTTTKEKVDVIHCHDHHTGLIPFLMTNTDQFSSLQNIPTILTIHNAQYQGHMSYDKLHYLPSFDQERIGLLDWYGSLNPLAAGIKCAWKVTTVSPNYMQELQKEANGLEGLLQQEKQKCTGVLNGIDINTWNPETDSMLVKNYSVSSVISGKQENKRWLCDQFNLNYDLPLFGFIGRLVGEKGADLLPEIVKDALQDAQLNFLFLGSGHQEIEEQLLELQEEFKGLYNVFIGYDEKLSHRIYAGADFLIMPSRVEPCGLNQMYALRYGTIPIVRRTGGLKDTVIDIGDNGFGICHDQTSVWDVCYSIQRGVKLYKEQPQYQKIQKQNMQIDNSWDQSANQYINIYKSLTQQQ